MGWHGMEQGGCGGAEQPFPGCSRGVPMNVFRGATTRIDLCASFEPETI